jgi:hypothetical protein
MKNENPLSLQTALAGHLHKGISQYIDNMFASMDSLNAAKTIKDQDHAVKIWSKNAGALALDEPFIALAAFKDLCKEIGMPRTKEIMQPGKERSRRLVFAAFNVMKEANEDFFSAHFPLVKHWGTEINRKRPA